LKFDADLFEQEELVSTSSSSFIILCLFRT
jgi:hypothetical protein